MLHLYALTDHPARLPASSSSASALNVVSTDEGVDAIVAPADADSAAPTDAAILAHAQVVEEIAAVNDAVLPARFGRGYADEEALVASIGERRAPLGEALARVRGCVEVGLRVFTDAAPANEERANGYTGRDYMLARLRHVEAAERTARELHEAVAASARDSTHATLVTPQLLLSAAYLLPGSEVPSFKAAVEAANAEHPELTLVCTGPWPPYSFAVVDVPEG